MTPLQVEVFMAERQFSLRLFGFACAVTERIPLLGIVFSISNRVGAAMFAHDLEKRQQLFLNGELKKLRKDETYNLGEIQGWKDLVRPSSPSSSQKNKLPFASQAEGDFNMPGAVQSDEAKAAAEAQGAEALRRRRYAQDAPSLPPRHGANAPGASSLPQDDAPPAYSEEDAQRALGANY